jgi:argininosuccinate lyase
MIRLADGYISTSSIMPQKRNPIALEHLRSSLSVTKGLADAVQLGYLKSPYGDISDREDVEDTLSAAFEQLDRNLQLFNAVLATMDVDRELLAKRARESFSVVTEIADEMVRSYRIPFRKAHHFVAKLVKLADERKYNLLAVSRDFFAEAYEQVFGEVFAFDFEPIRRAMDPEHFVACRDILGGTGPNAMADMLAGAERKIRENREWLRSAHAALQAADDKRKAAIQSILEGKGTLMSFEMR